MNSASPGRACPVSYRYGAAALRRPATLEVETLWIAGGLYGNRFALERLLELYDREPGSKALVFNGDFHWFDVGDDEFAAIDEGVSRFRATRGNVETELAESGEGVGCGCAYPAWVGDQTVAWSNAIIERLKRTARRHPRSLERLAALPIYLVAAVGAERVAIVHGDGESLAGWDFSQEALAAPAGLGRALAQFDAAGVRVFASSHTCLPVLQAFPGERSLVNNGAAGMPNFEGTRFGLASRISVRPGSGALYGARAGSLFVEAMALRYDAAAWQRRFLEQWPPGSEAHRSYFERIARGPRYGLAQALRPSPRRGAALAA